MPKKKLTPEEGKKLLEETKQRIRLEQEARTRERIEQIEFQRFDRLGIRLFNEYWTVEGPSDSQTELESFSDEEEDKYPHNPPSNTEVTEESSSSTNPNEVFSFANLTIKEENTSSNSNTEVEIPD